MTENKRRRIICEYCDWNYDEISHEVVFVDNEDIVGIPWPSLDAMHEAEKLLLKRKEVPNIYTYLLEIVKETKCPDEACYQVLCANSKDREMAFINTIQKIKPNEQQDR